MWSSAPRRSVSAARFMLSHDAPDAGSFASSVALIQMPAEAVGGGVVVGCVTVTVAAALLPPAVALMLAEPAAYPVTRPVVDAPATDGFELDQAKVTLLSVLPSAALAVAWSC